MTETEIITIITRWKEDARKLSQHTIREENYHAANYFLGKEKALKDVLELLNTSNKINTPWEV